MQVGVSTASLFNRLPNEDAVAFLYEQGVPLAEVFLTSFSEYTAEFAALLNERKKGLSVYSVHDLNTQFEPQLFAANDRVRKDAYSWLDKVMGAAKVLGAKRYTFHGTARVHRADHSGENDDFNRLGARLFAIVERCKTNGVGLCLENVEWATYNRLGVFKELKERVPDLLGVLDLKQARISGFAWQEYLKEMGKDLSHVHVSDLSSNGKICLPGKGAFNFGELVERLQGVGFNGPLIIETYSGDYDNLLELKRACEYLQELLYKKNCFTENNF
ncbi:MAG: sugar phosphate isomerase/epimerase [Clostridia bacterium]|nr:sugar phosphate isomerase/epimerase [Clostridia bacterium]